VSLGKICTRVVEVFGAALGYLGIGCYAELQPSPDVVASNTAATFHLMVTTAAAQVARPTRAAGLLSIDMSFFEMHCALVVVDALMQITEQESGITYQSVACIIVPPGADTHISGASPARIGAVRPAMDFMQCSLEIAERKSPPAQKLFLGLVAATDHLIRECVEGLPRIHRKSGGSRQYWRKACFVDPKGEEVV